MDLKPGYKQTEVGLIPDDWDICNLGKIGQGFIGLTYDPKDVRSDGVLVLRSSNITDGELQFQDNVYVEMKISERIVVCENDLLICVRNGSRSLIGKCALIDHRAVGMTFGAFMTVFRSSDNRFVFYCFQSNLVKRQINEHLGATINQITNKSLTSFQIPYPKSEERSAITKALGDADALIESLEQLLTKKRQIKKGAMQQLLTGKKRLPGFSREWKTRAFDGVLSRINAKVHQIPTSEYKATGRHPVVDQGKERVIGFSDRQDKLFRCPKGGVIVFGDHTCIVKFVDFDFLVGADGTQVLEAKSGQCTSFHALQLQHSGVTPTGYNRHFKFLKEREFVAPPPQEQTAIATILSDMDAEITALEAKLSKAHQIKQGMMQELLTGRIRLL